MASSSVSLLVTIMMMLLLPPLPACSSLSCRLDFTSMTLLSCQETAPQNPTTSCCNALIYPIDIWPIQELEKGLCCLSVYMVSRKTTFDLPTSYVSCGGKDCNGMPSSLTLQTAMVSLEHSLINHYVLHSIVLLLYYVHTPTEPCSCQLEKKGASQPQPLAPSGLGFGVIAAIAVVACVAIAGFLGWCVYYSWFCSPAPKARCSIQQVHPSISELINYNYNRTHTN
jgi:hypothetical protein